MKKMIYLLLTMFLVPIFVSAETLTYNVCDNGCEYTNFHDVKDNVNSITDLSDKDIVINIKNHVQNTFISFGSKTNRIKSITFNGLNNASLEISDGYIYADSIYINDIIITNFISIDSPNYIKVNNTDIQSFDIYFENGTVNLSDILEIDDKSLKNFKGLSLEGNIKIENMDFKNKVLLLINGTYQIINSQFGRIVKYPVNGSVITNVYNSKFITLKYKNIRTYEEFANELYDYIRTGDTSTLNYDIYDIYLPNYDMVSNTTVYFDKETKLKFNDKLNLVNYLDYYTEDKEIEYTIEDESIAKIENKELIALKEGSTKVTVTTDEGHVVYNINLVVEKETIPEKIDKMTIKVPITGSKIKAWVVAVSVILVGVALVCSYIFVKNIISVKYFRKT